MHSPIKREDTASTAVLFGAIVAVTIFQNFEDLRSVFDGNPLALYASQGPLLLKVGKDIIYLAMFIAVAAHAAQSKGSPLTFASCTVIFIVLILAVLTAAVHGVFTAAIGIRWAAPLLLFLLVPEWSLTLSRTLAARFLCLALTLLVGLQIAELTQMPPVFGEIAPGYSARVPGFFIAPNSAAFFGAACAAAAAACCGVRARITVYAATLALTSALLSQSGTGIIASVLLWIHIVFYRSRVKLMIAAALASAVIFINLDAITAREDYVSTSGGGRLEILKDIASDAGLQFWNFGRYTNAANLSNSDPESQTAVDSLIASMIGNFGIFFLPIILMVTLFVQQRSRRIEWHRLMPIIFVFAAFSGTTIVFEAFPMNIILPLGFWLGHRSMPNSA